MRTALPAAHLLRALRGFLVAEPGASWLGSQPRSRSLCRVAEATSRLLLLAASGSNAPEEGARRARLRAIAGGLFIAYVIIAPSRTEGNSTNKRRFGSAPRRVRFAGASSTGGLGARNGGEEGGSRPRKLCRFATEPGGPRWESSRARRSSTSPPPVFLPNRPRRLPRWAAAAGEARRRRPALPLPRFACSRRPSRASTWRSRSTTPTTSPRWGWRRRKCRSSSTSR